MNDEQEPGIKKRKRKWLLYLASLVFLSPILFYLASNLLLENGIGTPYLEKKLSQSLSAHVKITNAGWFPNGKFWLKKISIQTKDQDAPLVIVDCFSARIDQRLLIKKIISIHQVSIDKPEIAISTESLAAYIKKNAPPATPPVVVAQQNTQSQQIESKGKPTVAQNKPSEEIVKKSARAVPPLVYLSPEWLFINQASLKVFSSEKNQIFCKLQNLNLKLPVQGNDVKGELSYEGYHFPIEYKNQIWNIPVQVTIWNGINVTMFMQVARSNGFPFSVEKKITAENWTYKNLIAIKKIQAEGKAVGFLLAPQTWHGQGIAKSESNHFSLNGQTGDFPEAQAILLFQGASFTCPDYRFISDDFSVLGNARVSANGQHAAVARMIGSSETMRQAQSLGHNFSLPIVINAFQTTDRYACDLMLGGDFKQTWITNQTGEPLLDARLILKKFLSNKN